MSNDDYIYFAIFALNTKQADEVILKLREEEMDELASWLEEYKDQIYGQEAEEWKPFKGEKLVDIICIDSKYQPATSVIKELPKNYEELKKFKRLTVFFIDIFSVYTEQFRTFISKADWYFTEYGIKSCCILINYELPIEGQKHLESKFEEIWPCFKGCYEEGALHLCISAREKDVKNFKNYIKTIIPDGRNKPNPVTEKTVNNVFGNEKKSLPFN